MTTMNPERNRRHRLDTTDHRREIESRRADRRGPSESRIDDALEDIASHDVPGTPGLGTLQVLERLDESEWTTDNRNVRDFSITNGRPRHGALRSEDHVGRYEVCLPLSEVADDAVEVDRCPECGHWKAVFHYSAHHYISGGESVFCPECEAEHYSNEWG